MFSKIRNTLVAAALALVVSGTAIAGDGSAAGQIGAYGAIAGGVTASQYASSASGTASSDAAGGGQATAGVVGTGKSVHSTYGSDTSTATAAGQVGKGYAVTQTSGSNSAYGEAVGKNTGSGTGSSDTQNGGDYASKANSGFIVNYAGTDASAWAAGVVGAYGSFHY
jgi:hypothetical protein